MSVKRSGSPLESKAQTRRVNDGAAACADSSFDRIPDEILDLIFSFLPKETCKAVSLVDRRFNHVMADHYANRAIRSLDYGFKVKIPNFHLELAQEGVNFRISSSIVLNCKLLSMKREDHQLLAKIHRDSIEELQRFKADPSIKKDLARVDQARTHQLPQIALTPVFVTNQDEIFNWEEVSYRVNARARVDSDNTETFMQ